MTQTLVRIVKPSSSKRDVATLLLKLIKPYINRAIALTTPKTICTQEFAPSVEISIFIFDWLPEVAEPKNARVTLRRPEETQFFDSMSTLESSLKRYKVQSNPDLPSEVKNESDSELDRCLNFCQKFLLPSVVDSLTKRKAGGAIDPAVEVIIEFRQGSLFRHQLIEEEQNAGWVGRSHWQSRS